MRDVVDLICCRQVCDKNRHRNNVFPSSFVISLPCESSLLIDSRLKISFGIGMMSQTSRSISSYLKLNSTRAILPAPAADVTSAAQLCPAERASITAEVRERGGGAVKVYSQVERVFSRRREGKILEHLETIERRAPLTMEWSLRVLHVRNGRTNWDRIVFYLTALMELLRDAGKER